MNPYPQPLTYPPISTPALPITSPITFPLPTHTCIVADDAALVVDLVLWPVHLHTHAYDGTSHAAARAWGTRQRLRPLRGSGNSMGQERAVRAEGPARGLIARWLPPHWQRNRQESRADGASSVPGASWAIPTALCIAEE